MTDTLIAQNNRERQRHAFRVWLFEHRRDWPLERAIRWADRLVDRDRERDDRRLCVECKNLTAKWNCVQKEAVVAEQLQRCPKFEWEKPR